MKQEVRYNIFVKVDEMSTKEKKLRQMVKMSLSVKLNFPENAHQILQVCLPE